MTRREKEDREWRENYEKYIGSKEWQEIRQEALRLADNRCCYCESTVELQVHHETYIRLGNESQTDLAVLCNKCHLGLHEEYTRRKEGKSLLIYGSYMVRELLDTERQAWARVKEQLHLNHVQSKLDKEENRIKLIGDGKKICSKCEETKSVDDFSNNKTTKDGKCGYCRVCAKASAIKSKIKRQKLDESAELHSRGLKECIRCGRVKPLHRFKKCKHTGDKKWSFCKSCTR